MEYLKIVKKRSVKNTFCIFEECDLELIPKALPDYSSDSGSNYFYTNEGVFRESDHWGKAGNSKWRLLPLEKYNNLPNRRKKLGFAKWTSFHSDNTVEKLYFIELNFKNKEVYFNHKNNLEENQIVILRNSLETAKVIKKIRHYYKSNSKFKHFESEVQIENYLLDLINTI